jgi:hypothetical protein
LRCRQGKRLVAVEAQTRCPRRFRAGCRRSSTQHPSLRSHETPLLVQAAIFPVISGRTGTSAILGGAGDFDLELLESRTLDGHTQELVYRPKTVKDALTIDTDGSLTAAQEPELFAHYGLAYQPGASG